MTTTPSGRPRRAWSDELFDYGTIDSARVTRLTDVALDRAERLLADAAREAAGPAPTFEGVLGRIDLAEAIMWDARGEGALLVHVHPDADVRDAAQKAQERVATWEGDLPLRDDVNAAITAYAASTDAAALEGEPRRLLERWLRDLRRAGHALPAETRAEVRDISARIVGIGAEFERVLGEWSDGIDVTDEDLRGLDASYIARLGPGTVEGTRRISLEYPDVIPFLESSPRRDLRRILAEKMASRGLPRNRELLEEVLALRRRKAALLGYPSWAHYRIEPKMAATPERVADFHAGILPPLQALARTEHAAMAARLRADTGEDDLRSWDTAYYHRRILAEEHGVDQVEVSAHLPLDAVLDGLLDLCKEVFGLRFAEVDDPHAWHPDVRLFEVTDARTGERLGWCYMDLHPRDGKFGHAMAWPVRLARHESDGTRRGGVSAILANVPKPGPAHPALLLHDDAAMLFHEFGHVLHEVLGRNATHRLSMAGLEEDFPEAISQIMEHWIWQPAILQRIGRHHVTGAPMPEALARRLADSRYVGVGSDYLRSHGVGGTFDLLVHGREPVDLDEVRTRADAVRLLPSIDGTFWPAAFAHLVAGYDAGYYGYLWSLVYGDDLWSRFLAEGITNPAVGADYRRELLEPGATRDAEEMVARFLGRPATNEAFLGNTGIGPTPRTG